MRVTVIGMGQTLRGDDAAGIAAVQLWERTYPETAGRADVSVQYSELPGLGLLDLLDGFDSAVLVDAVETTDAPGRVHRLGLDELDAFGPGAKSAHGWGIAETLKMGHQLNPQRSSIAIRLVGIAAQQLEMGKLLSEAVEAALPAACEAIEEELQAFLSATPKA